MKRYLIIITVLLFILNVTNTHSQSRFPIWTFHEEDVNIYGLSVGAYSTIKSEFNTNTFGVRLETPGIGLLFALFPSNMNLDQDFISEKIYGMNVSLTGSFGCNSVSGINLNGISGYTFRTTGISSSLLINLSYKINGMQISGLSNESYFLNGCQIGLIGNTSKTMNGLQISLLGNISENTSGVQIGTINGGGNMKGLQIGLYNKSKTKTFQIGLWNKNGKRQLPLINF